MTDRKLPVGWQVEGSGFVITDQAAHYDHCEECGQKVDISEGQGVDDDAYTTCCNQLVCQFAPCRQPFSETVVDLF